ncbi:hypothetical protein [Streptomyces sp. NPDC001833]|uniref:hypothetical protein n=1 Tax=Streptomyces sp. NPDC001833 TaxID=3154658 RepID=UPI003331C3BE
MPGPDERTALFGTVPLNAGRIAGHQVLRARALTVTRAFVGRRVLPYGGDNC